MLRSIIEKKKKKKNLKFKNVKINYWKKKKKKNSIQMNKKPKI